MKLTRARTIWVALWGAVSLWLWMGFVGVLSGAVYHGLGDPQQTVLAWWLVLLVPPFLLGLVGGSVVWLEGRAASRKALLFYWIGLLAMTAVAGLLAGSPATVLALLNGKTSWAFFVGSCVLPWGVNWPGSRHTAIEPPVS